MREPYNRQTPDRARIPRRLTRRRDTRAQLIVCAGMLLVVFVIYVALGWRGAAPGNARAPRLGRPTAGTVVASTSVRTENWELTVTGVSTTGTLVYNAAGNAEDAAGLWLCVAVRLTNVGEEVFGVNTWDFAVVDADGTSYPHAIDGAAVLYPAAQGAERPENQPVLPGASIQLLLVFDVAPDVTGLRLVFQQDQRPYIDLGR